VIAALFVIVVYLVLERAIRSPWGRVLRAVREEEDAAAMSGKDVARVRLQAFVVGAVIMGIGGALYAHYMVAIDYSHFDSLYATFLIWVMLMLGGSGNNRGAIVGAFVIWGVWTGAAFLIDGLRPALAAISPDLPARGPYLRLMLIALVLILILLFRPKGLIGEERFVSRHSQGPRGLGRHATTRGPANRAPRSFVSRRVRRPRSFSRAGSCRRCGCRSTRSCRRRSARSPRR
jgi:branched-chain amino acid transport system permease protein